MTTFTEYLQNIQLTLYDYLCDIIIRNSDDETDVFPSYSMILYNEQDLYQNNDFRNRHLFMAFRRNFTDVFYGGEQMLSYYGSRNIPTEYRSGLIRELNLLVTQEYDEHEEYYNKIVKCGQKEGTYDDKILIHYWTRYSKTITLEKFTNYYTDKITTPGLK